jgi:Zn finger protein HypA/HybF involved in hydrogenase expression
VISTAIAKAALWECRRCGASTQGGRLCLAGSPDGSVATQQGEALTLDTASPSEFVDARLLRCPSCGSREIEIPFEILDGKRLR